MSIEAKCRDLRNAARRLASIAAEGDPARMDFLDQLYAAKDEVDRTFAEISAEAHTPAHPVLSPIRRIDPTADEGWPPPPEWPERVEDWEDDHE